MPWRICDPITHQPLAWHHWAGLGVIRVGDLRELAAAAPGDLPATVREGLPTIMRALPEAWAAALRSVAPPAQWLVSPDAADRRIWSRAPDGSLGASHLVSPTGAGRSCLRPRGLQGRCCRTASNRRSSCHGRLGAPGTHG